MARPAPRPASPASTRPRGGPAPASCISCGPAKRRPRRARCRAWATTRRRWAPTARSSRRCTSASAPAEAITSARRCWRTVCGPTAARCRRRCAAIRWRRSRRARRRSTRCACITAAVTGAGCCCRSRPTNGAGTSSKRVSPTRRSTIRAMPASRPANRTPARWCANSTASSRRATSRTGAACSTRPG